MQPRRAPAPSSGAGSTGGVILGKYKLGRLLGRGSFAKVYHAVSLSDNTAVAVKVIDKAKTVDAAMEPRILREVAAMRRLSRHPNILQIHELMATKTNIYLVMDLAPGGDLSAALRRRGGRFPELAARRYFRQLVSAVHFCHHHGVAHRDIKPQNLLLDDAGALKVTDFGLSALPDQIRHGLLHTACGTPAFAAPEVLSRHPYDGAKADAWSCGVILFLFLTGQLPFDDSNIGTMYQKTLRRDFQFPRTISKQAKFIIYHMLDPNPSTRLTIEALMNQSWFEKSWPLDQASPNSLPQPTKDRKFTATEMNAFDIISMSAGLDLSGLFENGKRERRFTAAAPAEEVEERVAEVGGKLGYRVERKMGMGMGLVKGRTALVAEILAVAEKVVVVVVKAEDGGGWDFEEFHWDDLKVGLEGVALSWPNDVC